MTAGKRLRLIQYTAKHMGVWGMIREIILLLLTLNYGVNFRLAHASLNQHQEAVHCYKKAVAMEPNNESYLSNLQIAEEKLKQNEGASPTGIPGMPGMPGMPNIPGLDVGSMLNNPGLMSMAQQMLSNPSMQQL